jgi:hypothetical protein
MQALARKMVKCPYGQNHMDMPPLAVAECRREAKKLPRDCRSPIRDAILAIPAEGGLPK